MNYGPGFGGMESASVTSGTGRNVYADYGAQKIAAVPDGTITSELESLRRAVGELGQKIGEAESRMQFPPEPEPGGVSGRNSPGHASGLASSLFDQVCMLRSFAARVDRIGRAL